MLICSNCLSLSKPSENRPQRITLMSELAHNGLKFFLKEFSYLYSPMVVDILLSTEIYPKCTREFTKKTSTRIHPNIISIRCLKLYILEKPLKYDEKFLTLFSKFEYNLEISFSGFLRIYEK